MSVHLHHCFYGISDEVCNHHGSCAEVGAHGDVTETVYEYIYEDSSPEAYLEYLLATYAPLRDVVRKMLLAQVKYAIINNFVDEFSGVNIAKGSAMDGRVLRSAVRVAPQVDRLCRQNVPGMNFCLKTITELPLLPSWLYRQGY